MKRYVCTSCHSIPVLNRILSKKQLEQLLDGEHFEKIPFEDTAMKQYLEIYRSENWMLIGGKLLSKKARSLGYIGSIRSDTVLKVLYLNGTTAKAKVNLEIRENRYEEFIAVLRELAGYEGALDLYGKEGAAGREICGGPTGLRFRSGAYCSISDAGCHRNPQGLYPDLFCRIPGRKTGREQENPPKLMHMR